MQKNDDVPVTAYRIADIRHPIFDGTGAMLYGGRWNSIGQPVIYASESYAGAMLEVLVHANLSTPPRNQHVVRISIPGEVRIESLSPMTLAGWDAQDQTRTQAFGDRWLRERRSAVLRVPSIVTEGRENNLLINPLHRRFPLIQAGEPERVFWDIRLFRERTYGS